MVPPGEDIFVTLSQNFEITKTPEYPTPKPLQVTTSIKTSPESTNLRTLPVKPKLINFFDKGTVILPSKTPNKPIVKQIQLQPPAHVNNNVFTQVDDDDIIEEDNLSAPEYDESFHPSEPDPTLHSHALHQFRPFKPLPPLRRPPRRPKGYRKRPHKNRGKRNNQKGKGVASRIINFLT